MPNLSPVRDALRAELTVRGYEVASDTLGRSGLYVAGADDLARALFEIKPSAEEAVATMYQGSWVAGLPPRFAVLPAAEAASPQFELLEQMHITPILFEQHADVVTFRDLDALLGEHLPR